MQIDAMLLDASEALASSAFKEGYIKVMFSVSANGISSCSAGPHKPHVH